MPATYRLRIGGFVERPMEFTLAHLQARPIGASRRSRSSARATPRGRSGCAGLLSNGVWTGVGLKSLLKECGVKPEAREVLFLGLDRQTEKKFQAGNREYEAPHGRAINVHRRANPDTMLAFALNGQPIPAEQGFPVRLLVPGWYGMTQVKWLGRIEVLDRRYEGQHLVRNYLSLRSVETPDGPLWLDTSISQEPAQVAGRARDPARANAGWDYPSAARRGAGRRRSRRSTCRSTAAPGSGRRSTRGAANYALAAVVADGPNLAPGPHTLVSRAIDATGKVQPTKAERDAEIASGREDNAQWTREIRVEP